MAEEELLEMLVSEADRRIPAIIDGVKGLTDPPRPSSEGIEEIRVEVHGLKGAAMVIGQSRLSELARLIEIALVQRIGPGAIEARLGDQLVGAAEALREGVHAAAHGEAEPPAVGQAVDSLSAGGPAG